MIICISMHKTVVSLVLYAVDKKAFVAEASCNHCYCFCYIFAHDQFARVNFDFHESAQDCFRL